MPSAATVAKGDRVVFTSGAASFTARDILDAAHFRGELEPSWRKLLLQVEAERKATGSGAEVAQDALNSSAIAFRYKHDLITAEETEKWLEARLLTLLDFSEFFARAYWEKTFGSRVAPPALPFHGASLEQRELLTAELTLSGELDRQATRLAWRVAACLASEGAEIPPPLLAEEEQLFRTRVPDVAEWLAGLGRERPWLDEMLAAEAGFRERCARVISPEQREREMSALRLPLTRFEVEMMELDSKGAAQEAFLCVRDDGMEMEEVAQEGRYPYRRRELVLEDIDPAVQQKYLSSTPGTVLEPVARGDGFQLVRLIGKREPKLDDPEVGPRIDQRLLDRHFAELTSGSIRWIVLSSPS
ncbi:MAG: hypothetical protein H0V56_13625 [Chthoniobacterales bacterium]|nr:hypothetical protein [Chthoniobacterales bacterium]